MDGNRWVKVGVNPDLKQACNNIDMEYYNWRLLDDELKVAHVIQVNIENESILEEYWEGVVNNVAVYLQGEIDDIFQRSNFYICFFVKNNVSNNLIEKIENDQYSSKKYVFTNSKNMSQDDKLKRMANKMFIFKYKSEVLDNVGRVRKVKLRNFRSYCGLKEFDFSDKDNKGAQLVVIFAPNGYGKTSFFDAIEWTLTGKIDRLEKVKNSAHGFRGNVIANTNMDKKEDSYTEIIIDNGDKIKKQVKQIKGKRKQDYDDNNIDEDSINGLLYIRFTEWNDLILPHHKIDNFVASLTPEQRFIEWGGFWDTSGEKINKFKSTYANYLENKDTLDELQKEISIKEKCIEKFENDKKYISEFIAKLKKYNAIPNVRLIQLNEMDINFREYQKLVDKISRYESEYKEEKLENIEADIYVKTSMKSDLEKLEVDKNKLRDINEKYKNIVELSNKYLKYVDLQKRLEEARKRKVDNIKKIEPIKSIVELGERWFFQAKEYNYSNRNICDLRELEGKQKKQLEIYKRNINSINQKIEEIKLELDQEKEYKKLSNNVKKIIDYNNAIKRYCLQLEEVGGELQNIIDKKFYETEYIKKIKLLKIVSPEEVLQKKEEFIVLIEEIKDYYLVSAFEELFEKVGIYEKQKEKLNEINKEIMIEEKVDKKISDFVIACREIIVSKELSYCPVCNNKINNSKQLLNKNINKNELKIEELYDKSNIIKNSLNKLNEEVQEIIDSINRVIDNIVVNSEKKLMIIDKRFIEVKQKEIDINKEIDKIKKICELIIQKDKEKNILIEYSYDALEKWRREWYRGKNEEVENNKKIFLEMNNLYNQVLKTVCDTQKMIEDFKKVVNKSQNDHKFMINFSKYEDYLEFEYVDIENKYNMFISKQNKIDEEVFRIEESLKTYIDMDSNRNYAEEKQNIKILIEELQQNIDNQIKNINSRCRIFQNDCKSLEKVKKEIEEKGIWLSEILNTIGDLKYNKEIDCYFENYNKEKVILKELKFKFSSISNKCQKYKEEYDTTKKDLENGFKEFFNEFHVSDIYEKIEPHNELKEIECHFEINKDKPALKIEVIDDSGNSYIPEWYFSTAQLNIIAFSLFLGRALYVQKAVLKSVFIDDPIGHFDDMNIVAFVDLLRNLISNTDRQFIISTHEERVFNLIQRKIPKSLYSVSYIDLRR